MTISERLFTIMKEQNISIPELGCMKGISGHTIFDWQKKNTNPGADKIMVICEALRITPEELLIGGSRGENSGSAPEDDIENRIMQECRELSDDKKKRLLAYASMLTNVKEKKAK